MRIVRLDVKNVKRIRAVEIAPDGNVVVVGGRNSQGKSSLLDSIMYALAGKDATCREPVRRGEDRAEITVDLGEVVVRRTLKPDGSGTLVVENKAGARYPAPQGRLDDLIGRLAFDPLEFSRMGTKAQAETLRAVLGLDFDQLDGERARLFDARTAVNRDGKSLQARLEAMPPRHDGVPDAEQSPTALFAELDGVQAVNDANARQRQLLADIERDGLAASAEHKSASDEAARLRRALADVEARMRVLEERVEKTKREFQTEGARVAALVDADFAPIKARMADLDATNRKVRENAARAAVEAQLAEALAKSVALSDTIAGIDERKAAAMAAAPFPVEGLGFNEDGGVTFGGLPLDQASASEKLRVSAAIGVALNPQIRVLLIRDGSLLDAESLELLGEFAEKNDVQLWLERVEDDGATIVIEDGSAVAAVAAELKP